MHGHTTHTHIKGKKTMLVVCSKLCIIFKSMDQKSQLHHTKCSAQAQKDAHILVVSFPLQGHAAPLMKLSHQIANRGIKVTFMTTEFTCAKIVAALPEPDLGGSNLIRLVSFSDGLPPEHDRSNMADVAMSLRMIMPAHLADLIKKSNKEARDDKVTGVIMDAPLGWALQIPKKMGIKCATYWCSSPGCLALALHIPKLIECKVIDHEGSLLRNEKIELLPSMPKMSTGEFTWLFPGNQTLERPTFLHIQEVINTMKKSDFLLCNWFHELDPSATALIPNLLSIGPLLADGRPAGNFCSEDFGCITWLDKHSPKSVIYVAFGSTSKLSQAQIDELALGLELVDRPFLWVAWSGLTSGFSRYPDGFTERVAQRGKMVEWAPQEMVLSHPSVACFVSHCGWNSTMESLRMGVPFLCWPYFGDQLYIQTCICDCWKVGLRLNTVKDGVVPGIELKLKVEKLLGDSGILANAMRFKELAGKSTSKEGSSSRNLKFLIEQMKC